MEQAGYNLFDSNDSFYNDFCTPYTTLNGTDIILADRKTDIFNKYGNIILCQSECQFKYYNKTSEKVKCQCNVQTKKINLDIFSISFEKEEIIDTFYNTLANSNFQVLRCFKLAFDLNSIFKNIGRIIMSLILFINIILFILYFIFGDKKLNQFLGNIIK